MSIITAKPEHEAVYQDLNDLLRRHKNVSDVEILAIAANMVGKLIAMQDQRTMTTTMALEIVTKNIEAGNQQMMDMLLKSGGSA